ncbi:SPASM domain-containing protein [Flavobacteriales bacterium]|nr:SPASM domain-containing protein [Flavobacteriales bacterium]
MALGWQHKTRTLRDRYARIRPLNAKRLKNLVALHAGYRKAHNGGQFAQNAMPMSLSIEPTTSCNLRCPECPSGLRSFSRPTGMLEPEQLDRLLQEIGGYLVYANLYFQGEPYLHPAMDHLVALCKQHGIYTSTSTNAHFLRPERAEAIVASGLDRLIISIDGMTQETYSSYRIGGRLDKVLEGTQNVLDARRKSKGAKTPHIVWQFLVVGPNEHEVPEIRKMARASGVDELVIKTAQLDEPHDAHPLLTSDPKLRRYDRQSNGIWKLRNALNDECWRMWQGCVMTWDGKVVPCCFDKDAEHAMGQVGPQSFEEIWFSEGYQAFRQQIFTDRSSIEMCRNCTEGTAVYAG